MKYLLLLAIIGIAWWAIRSRRQSAQSVEPAEVSPETMCRCAYCGVYFPLGDGSTAADGHVFCSQEHRAMGARVEPDA